jgi:diaminopimelate dehydrogenase
MVENHSRTISEGSEESEELVKNLIMQYLTQKKYALPDMSMNELSSKLYEYMAGLAFLRKYIYAIDTEEVDIDSWQTIWIIRQGKRVEKIPDHFANVNGAALESKHTALISAGWDPGLFSILRAYSSAVLPNGSDYTFWGRGVSQGHSDAIRRIDGVLDARQYTVPVPEAMAAVRAGENPELSTREKHTRECFVVAEEGADLDKIENEIVTMPAYFADYDTTVEFISEEEMAAEHSGLPHGGFVIRSGKTGWKEENKAICEFKLDLDSNPEFTSSVIAAYARAAYRMAQEGFKGCKTIFDVPISYVSSMTPEEMRKMML